MKLSRHLEQLRDYFVAAIGSQRPAKRAVREPPPTGREHAARCSGGEVEGIPPICVAPRRPPEEPILDQSLLLPHKSLRSEADRGIKSALRVIPSIFVSFSTAATIFRHHASIPFLAPHCCQGPPRRRTPADNNCRRDAVRRRPPAHSSLPPVRLCRDGQR